jgi:hypothetical protein
MIQKDKMRIAAAEAQGWTGPWRFGNEHLHGTPPGKTPAEIDREGEHVPEQVDKIIVDLCKQIMDLSDAIVEVNELMNDSSGVISSQIQAGLWQLNYVKGLANTWIS